MATHHTPNGVRLKVRLLAGRCEIETAETTETEVECTPMNRSSASREAADAVVEELRDLAGGKELVVEVPKRKRLVPGFGDAQVLIRVRGPHGLGLEQSALSGFVDDRRLVIPGEERFGEADGGDRGASQRIDEIAVIHQPARPARRKDLELGRGEGIPAVGRLERLRSARPDA